jgi:hypothetical protein
MVPAGVAGAVAGGVVSPPAQAPSSKRNRKRVERKWAARVVHRGRWLGAGVIMGV